MKPSIVRLIFLFVIIILPITVTSSQILRYEVWVKTSNIEYAGTDGHIGIIFYNSNGEQSPKIILDDDNKITHNDGLFERNNLDKFICQVDHDMGPIEKITVSNDNSGGSSSGWHLQWIQVYYPAPHGTDPRFKSSGNKNVSTFDFGGWLDTGHGLTHDLLTTDNIGRVMAPVHLPNSRAVLEKYHVGINENYTNDPISKPYVVKEQVTNQVQYCRTEGQLSEFEFHANMEFDVGFASTSIDLTNKIQKTCTESFGESYSITHIVEETLPLTAAPGQVVAGEIFVYKVETEGIVSYYDFANSRKHKYTITIPDMPYSDPLTVAFTVSTKNENGNSVRYLDPVDLRARITKEMIDKLQTYGYKVNVPGTHLQQSSLGSLYRIKVNTGSNKKEFILTKRFTTTTGETNIHIKPKEKFKKEISPDKQIVK